MWLERNLSFVSGLEMHLHGITKDHPSRAKAKPAKV